jgi:phage terminase large subunit
MVCHRRAGKTVASIMDLVRHALKCPISMGRYAYIAPHYVQAKDVAWVYLKQFTAAIPGIKTNEGELYVEFPNGSRIRLYGADNYDRLRGGYLNGVVLDEYADMSPFAWTEVIRPMLADHKGFAVFIGTPKGRNAFFEKYKESQESEDWFSYILPASESGLLDQEELDAARAEMPIELYNQEFECSFDSAIYGAYYARQVAEMERAGRITDVPVDVHSPVHSAWDLGKADATSIWLFQVIGGQVRFVDHIESNGKELDYYVREINSKNYPKGITYLPQDAKAKILGMAKTRVEQLQALGCDCEIVPPHTLQDGISAVRKMLEDCWIDKDMCAHGLECIRQYRSEFDEKRNVLRVAPLHDWTSHAADAVRYAAMASKDMRLPTKPKPKRELVFEANEVGQLTSNMSVREIIEMRRRQRALNE